MDKKESLIYMERSLDSVLFLVPQAARNVLEALRRARGVAWDDSPDEIKAVFRQREALLGKLYKAIDLMSRGVWDLAEERLQELVVEGEELRAKLHLAQQERSSNEFRKQLEELEARLCTQTRP